MFIAHAPFGYVISVAVMNRVRSTPTKLLIVACMLGALAPDFDLAYLHLIEHGRTHHHRYFTHWPIIWISLTFICAIAYINAKRSGPALVGLMFSIGGFSHMILDSLVGDIWWFAPFLDLPFSFAHVPALYHPWWLNFVLHWSFVVELLICAWAFQVYRRRSRILASQGPSHA